MHWSLRSLRGLGVTRAVAALLAFSAVVLAASSAGAQGTDESVDPVIATFETADGSTFRAVLERAEDIARAEAALETDGQAGIPSGALAAGDGGINAPHDWHLIDVELADVTIELCDGTATMVDDDLDYWLNTVGSFCPWSATLIALEPAVDELPDTGAGSTAAARSLLAWMALAAVAVLTAITAGFGSRKAHRLVHQPIRR